MQGLEHFQETIVFVGRGKQQHALTELVTRLGLLGRSDTAWQYAQYNIVWEGLRQDFELEDRFQDLDYKLNLIQTQVKFLLGIYQNRKRRFLGMDDYRFDRVGDLRFVVRHE